MAGAKDGVRFAADGGGAPFGVRAFQILPTLIFSSLMAVMYHLGACRSSCAAWPTSRSAVLGMSGSESLSACANVFVGQTDAPLLVRLP